MAKYVYGMLMRYYKHLWEILKLYHHKICYHWLLVSMKTFYITDFCFVIT